MNSACRARQRSSTRAARAVKSASCSWCDGHRALDAGGMRREHLPVVPLAEQILEAGAAGSLRAPRRPRAPRGRARGRTELLDGDAHRVQRFGGVERAGAIDGAAEPRRACRHAPANLRLVERGAVTSRPVRHMALPARAPAATARRCPGSRRRAAVGHGGARGVPSAATRMASSAVSIAGSSCNRRTTSPSVTSSSRTGPSARVSARRSLRRRRTPRCSPSSTGSASRRRRVATRARCTRLRITDNHARPGFGETARRSDPRVGRRGGVMVGCRS